MVDLNTQGDGGGRTMEEYIATYFVAGTKKVGIQLLIREIENLCIKIIVLVLTWMSRSSSFNQASRPLMFYAMECLRRTIYDWCTTLLSNIKS
jgi:hypothetical protein